MQLFIGQRIFGLNSAIVFYIQTENDWDKYVQTLC